MIDIFLINLERSPKRLDQMDKRLKSLSLNYHLVKAIDGKSLTKPEISNWTSWKTRFLLGRVLRPGEIGCYLSHLGVYKNMLNQDYKAAMVLEDDVEIKDELPMFCSCLELLPNDWDIVRLEKRSNKQGVLVETLKEKFQLYRLFHCEYGTAGYLVSQSGAKKILSISRKLFWPIDFVMARYWTARLNVYEISPPLINEREEGFSEIQPDNIIYTKSHGLSKLSPFYLTKRMRVLYDSFMKRRYRFKKSF